MVPQSSAAASMYVYTGQRPQEHTSRTLCTYVRYFGHIRSISGIFVLFRAYVFYCGDLKELDGGEVGAAEQRGLERVRIYGTAAARIYV